MKVIGEILGFECDGCLYFQQRYKGERGKRGLGGEVDGKMGRRC